MATVSGVATITQTKVDGTKLTLGQAFAGSTAFVETTDIDFGSIEFRKMIRTIRYVIETRPTLGHFFLTIKHRDSIEDGLLSTTPIDLGVGGSDSPVSIRVPVARFYRFRFEDTAVQKRWKLGAFDIFGTIAGQRART